MNNTAGRVYFQIKILTILVTSIILSGLVNKAVFIANTPQINMVALLELKNSPLTIFDKSTRFMASFIKGNSGKNTDPDAVYKTFKFDTFSQIPINQLNQVTKGVYAKEDKTNNIIYIRVAPDAQWEEKEITLDGKKALMRFPKGTFK